MQAEHARRKVQLADRGLIGRLRVGFISSAAALLVPPLVIKFRQLYPGVELDLRNVLTADQVIWLREKKLDLGLLRLPIASEELTAELLHKEPFAVFLPAAHPLSRHNSLRLEQLNGEKFVMYSRKLAPGFHDLVMNMLLSAGVNPEIVQEAGEMYTIIALVAAGLGVALLPRSVELHQIPGVVSRDLPSGLPFSEIGIAVRKGDISPAVKLFRDLALSMRRELAKLRVPIKQVPSRERPRLMRSCG